MAAVAVQVKKDVAFVYGCFEPFGWRFISGANRDRHGLMGVMDCLL